MVLFQKNLPPEINNNNYNYSTKKQHISYFSLNNRSVAPQRREQQFWENKTASWRFVLADMKVTELCRMILRRKIERRKEVFMNIEAPSKLWILCCVCCCGNTGQRLFCVIQWYCINIPQYLHTIAAHAIMLLFNWKLIKYINKNRETLLFCFPQQLLNQFIFISDYFIAFLGVFASYCRHAKNIAGAQDTLLLCPIWHVASQICPSLSLSLSRPLSLFSFSIITFFSPWARDGLSGVTSIAEVFSLSPTMHLEGTWPSLGLSERLLALLPWGEGGGWQWRCPSLSLSVTQTEAGPLMASSSRAF